MISILVCSVRPDLYQQLVKNVAKTIGVDYEILYYDNRKGSKGICEVYNLLAQDAKYKILCFIHEDVVFTTTNWGKILLKIFSENDIGVVGVAGSKYKSEKFSGWFTGIPQLDCGNIIHQYPDRREKIFLQPTEGDILEDVVCIDGVFICCTSRVWSDLKFDSENIKGFHFYDIDFSIRAAKRYKVVVTYEIEIIHITVGGDFGDRWVKMAIDYHQHNKHILPFTKQNVSPDTEVRVAKTNLDLLKPFPISFNNKLKWVWLQKLWRYPLCYYDIVKFFIYRPFGLKHLHYIFKSK
jgi:hypothetical protein